MCKPDSGNADYHGLLDDFHGLPPEQQETVLLCLRAESKVQNAERKHRESMRKLLFLFILAAVAVAGLVALLIVMVFVYRDKPEYMEKLIYSLGSAAIGALGGAAGGAAGFGYSKSRQEKQSQNPS